MATIEEIKNELKVKKEEHMKAGKELEAFKKGENDGKWLEELRGEMRRKELDEEGKEEKRRLEEELKQLKKNVNDWGEQVIYLQKKFAEFGGKGNEQIA